MPRAWPNKCRLKWPLKHNCQSCVQFSGYDPEKLVLIGLRVHLFPSRTQKLSSGSSTIVCGWLHVKIDNANTSGFVRLNESAFYIHLKFGACREKISKKMKKGLDKWGYGWYYMPARCGWEKSLPGGKKKVRKNRKKFLTNGWRCAKLKKSPRLREINETSEDGRVERPVYLEN